MVNEEESLAAGPSLSRRVQFSPDNETQLISQISNESNSERLISTISPSLTWFEMKSLEMGYGPRLPQKAALQYRNFRKIFVGVQSGLDFLTDLLVAVFWIRTHEKLWISIWAICVLFSTILPTFMAVSYYEDFLTGVGMLFGFGMLAITCKSKKDFSRVARKFRELTYIVQEKLREVDDLLEEVTRDIIVHNQLDGEKKNLEAAVVRWNRTKNEASKMEFVQRATSLQSHEVRSLQMLDTLRSVTLEEEDMEKVESGYDDKSPKLEDIRTRDIGDSMSVRSDATGAKDSRFDMSIEISNMDWPSDSNVHSRFERKATITEEISRTEGRIAELDGQIDDKHDEIRQQTKRLAEDFDTIQLAFIELQAFRVKTYEEDGEHEYSLTDLLLGHDADPFPATQLQEHPIPEYADLFEAFMPEKEVQELDWYRSELAKVDVQLSHIALQNSVPQIYKLYSLITQSLPLLIIQFYAICYHYDAPDSEAGVNTDLVIYISVIISYISSVVTIRRVFEPRGLLLISACWLYGILDTWTRTIGLVLALSNANMKWVSILVAFPMAIINGICIYMFFRKYTDMIIAWGNLIIILGSSFLGATLCVTVAPVLYIIYQCEPAADAPLIKIVKYEAVYRSLWAIGLLSFVVVQDEFRELVYITYCTSIIAPILLIAMPSVIAFIPKTRIILDPRGEFLDKYIQNQKEAFRIMLEENAGYITVAGLSKTNLSSKANQDRLLKKSQEVTISPKFKDPYTREVQLMCMCDGHGANGGQVSQFVVEYVGSELFKRFEKSYMQGTNSMEALLSNLVSDCFRGLKKSQIDIRYSGSTCLICLVFDGKIWIANLGDSRAVIAREVKGSLEVKPLSRDAIPDQHDFLQVITAKGGRVTKDPEGNVVLFGTDGDKTMSLGMATSLGDTWAESYGLSHRPEISSQEVNDEDLFIILGSDGIWSIYDNEQIASLCYNGLKDIPDPKEVCKKIVVMCIEEWRRKYNRVDDVSMILHSFREELPPKLKVPSNIDFIDATSGLELAQTPRGTKSGFRIISSDAHIDAHIDFGNGLVVDLNDLDLDEEVGKESDNSVESSPSYIAAEELLRGDCGGAHGPFEVEPDLRKNSEL